MKRYIMFVCLSVLMLEYAAAQSLMYVTVKSVQLKASTDLFAADQGTLVYGNQVTVLQEKGRWTEVRSSQSALRGWMASAGLTSKRIVASGGAASASASELALAGKGFSEAVEQVYQQDSALDYTLVDAMEIQYVSRQELQNFLTQGHLIIEE